MRKITERRENGVLYEKMCISGNYLFVAAHQRGLRIFDIADPENPQLVSGLDAGFSDAFAIAVDGDYAYVADGGGGLKVVDISNISSPEIIAGEDRAPCATASPDKDNGSINNYVTYSFHTPGTDLSQQGHFPSTMRFLSTLKPILCMRSFPLLGQ